MSLYDVLVNTGNATPPASTGSLPWKFTFSTSPRELSLKKHRHNCEMREKQNLLIRSWRGQFKAKVIKIKFVNYHTIIQSTGQLLLIWTCHGKRLNFFPFRKKPSSALLQLRPISNQGSLLRDKVDHGLRRLRHKCTFHCSSDERTANSTEAMNYTKFPLDKIN